MKFTVEETEHGITYTILAEKKASSTYTAAESISAGDYVEWRPFRDRQYKKVWPSPPGVGCPRWLMWLHRWRIWRAPELAGIALADAAQGEPVEVSFWMNTLNITGPTVTAYMGDD